jgi:hypothetical protein
MMERLSLNINLGALDYCLFLYLKKNDGNTTLQQALYTGIIQAVALTLLTQLLVLIELARFTRSVQ